MKILFVAVFAPNSTNVAQARGFRDNGITVIEYDYRAKLGQFGGIAGRDIDLVNFAKTTKPDLVLFSKCNQMHYSVIDACNEFTKTCMWYMDGLPNFNGELIDKIKRCTYVISGVEGVTPYALEYNPNTTFINQCPDEKMNFMLDNIVYKDDISFIGSIQSVHGNRSEYIEKLIKEYDKFKYHNGVYGLEHNRVINETKINLNIAPTDAGGISVRVYKILASGGFLMSTPWENMEEAFTIGEEIAIFNSWDELKDKINYYLNNEDERNRIRLNGLKKVKEFLPKKWGEKIINYCK